MAYSKLKWKISLGRGVLWMKSVHLEQHSVPFFAFCAYFVVGKKLSYIFCMMLLSAPQNMFRQKKMTQ